MDEEKTCDTCKWFPFYKSIITRQEYCNNPDNFFIDVIGTVKARFTSTNDCCDKYEEVK